MSERNDQEMSKQQAWLAFFVETNAEVRARRISEYSYTAAAIAAFGALAWGVASLGNKYCLFGPVVAAVVAIFFLLAAVLCKILDEHKKHYMYRKESVRLAKLLAESHSIDLTELPIDFRKEPEPGTGHLWSALVLKVGGLGAAVFCISIGFSNKITLICGIISVLLIYASNKWMKYRDKKLKSENTSTTTQSS